jgi:hypothetical protein
MKAANIAGNPWTRNLAMMHVAMSDAVNSVQGRYASYVSSGPVKPGASAEAAAAAAARQILLQQAPGQKALIDQAYAETTKAIPDGAAKTDGVAIGEKCAAAVLADRAADGTNVPDTYRPMTTPGVWIPTAPPLFAEYARVKPWVLKSADQFRPGPPPDLKSALYARDYNETKEVGGAKSSKRTAEQTDAVKFWSQANLSVAWEQVARQLSAAKNLSLADSQRRPGRQRCHRARCELDVAQRRANASRVPVAGRYHRRRGDRRPGGGVRAETGNGGDRH